MNKKIYYIILLITIGYTTSTIAQGNAVSPYSRLGIGDMIDPNLANIRNMGGTGISYNDIYQINASNPASYSSLRSSAFNIGLFAKLGKLEDKSSSTNVWSGNINNLSLAFPMRNPINDILDRVDKKYSWGMAFHLVPHSVVGYKLVSEDNDDEYGDITRSYAGQGGTYKFMWGNALRYKDISFGVHLGYLFGNISNTRNIIFNDIPAALNNFFKTDYHVSGFIWDAGLMYTYKINENQVDKNDTKKLKKITFGLTFKPNTGFKTLANTLNISAQTGTGIGDTLQSVVDREGKGTLPSTIGFGVNYQYGSVWNFGVNYKLENWSNYENDEDHSGTLDNAYSLSLGGYYRPNANSYSNFLKRIKYQFGTYYRKDPRSFQGSNLDSYGVTFGFGMPYVYKRKISHANLGFDFGYKGKDSPLMEKYMQINFGFTFNDDSWFLKRKYN